MYEARLAAQELVANSPECSDMSEPESVAESGDGGDSENGETGDEAPSEAPRTPAGAGALDSDEEPPLSQECRLDEEEMESSSSDSEESDKDSDGQSVDPGEDDQASLSNAVQEQENETVRNSSPDEFDPLYVISGIV